MTNIKTNGPILNKNGDSQGPADTSYLDGEPGTKRGETRWSQVGEDSGQTPAPKQPNERDESATSQEASSPSIAGIGKASYIAAVTQVDTDRGPVMDAVYNGAITEGSRMTDSEDVNGPRDHKLSTSSRMP